MKKRRGRPRKVADEDILEIIREFKEVSQPKIREMTGLKESTLSMIIKRLRGEGKVTTRTVRDGKSTLSMVSLIDGTPKGKEPQKVMETKGNGVEVFDLEEGVECAIEHGIVSRTAGGVRLTKEFEATLINTIKKEGVEMDLSNSVETDEKIADLAILAVMTHLGEIEFDELHKLVVIIDRIIHIFIERV